MSYISRRAANLKLSVIKEVAAEVKRTPGIISLAQGLPSFSTPEYIRKSTADALLADEKGIGAYTLYSGTKQLKKAIGQKLLNEYKAADSRECKPIETEKEIFVSVGAMEGLAASILAIVDPGDEVILPAPNYPAHIAQVKLAGGNPVFVPLRALGDSGTAGWSLKLEDLEEKITEKTKLIVFTNPGNPTGCLFDYKLLKGIVDLAKRNNLWVLADETYSFLTYNNLPYISLGVFRKDYSKLIVVRSFSKEYAMTGWRIGYVYAPERLVRQALKIHDALVGCPSSVSQKGALAALEGAQAAVDRFKKEFAERLRLVCSQLDQFSNYFEYIKPQGSYYIWVRLKVENGELKAKNSTEFALNLLREAKVAVVPGEAFGPGGENFFRVCFAVSRVDIKEAFKRIREYLRY